MTIGIISKYLRDVLTNALLAELPLDQTYMATLTHRVDHETLLVDKKIIPGRLVRKGHLLQFVPDRKNDSWIWDGIGIPHRLTLYIHGNAIMSGKIAQMVLRGDGITPIFEINLEEWLR